MRQILLSSAIALALGVAPANVFAQSEMTKKKPPEQSEGQEGGQKGTQKGQAPAGGQNMDNGGETGQESPMKPKGDETKQPKMQREEQKNEQNGETGQPTEKRIEEQGGGNKQSGETKEKHAGKHRVSEDQRTELKRVFSESHVKPAPQINFSVGVGAHVPREVHLYQLPPRIVEIIPDFEGFMYFELPDGRIAVVDPNSLEIVLIIA
jgi:Protein of unknown function (DUF1236)